jgi:hypothetical protein
LIDLLAGAIHPIEDPNPKPRGYSFNTRHPHHFPRHERPQPHAGGHLEMVQDPTAGFQALVAAGVLGPIAAG